MKNKRVRRLAIQLAERMLPGIGGRADRYTISHIIVAFEYGYQRGFVESMAIMAVVLVAGYLWWLS